MLSVNSCNKCLNVQIESGFLLLYAECQCLLLGKKSSAGAGGLGISMVLPVREAHRTHGFGFLSRGGAAAAPTDDVPSLKKRFCFDCQLVELFIRESSFYLNEFGLYIK